MSRRKPEVAADTRERLDLAAGLAAQALKLLAIQEAQPAGALAALRQALAILERLVAEGRRPR